MGRYKLMFYDKTTGESFPIMTPEADKIKERVDITSIDLFVIKNASQGLDPNISYDEQKLKENFIHFINDNNYSKIKIPTNASIYITYKHDNRDKYLEVIYKSFDLINLAQEYDRIRKGRNMFFTKNTEIKGENRRKYDKQFYQELNKTGTYFKNFIDRVFKDIEGKSTLTHISGTDRKYIGSRMTDAIREYSISHARLKETDHLVEAIDAFNDAKQNIIEELYHYKVLRGLLIYIENQYFNKVEIKEAKDNDRVYRFKKRLGCQDVEDCVNKIRDMIDPVEMEIENSFSIRDANIELIEIYDDYKSKDYDDDVMFENYENNLELNATIDDEIKNIKMKVLRRNNIELEDRNMVVDANTHKTVEIELDNWRPKK